MKKKLLFTFIILSLISCNQKEKTADNIIRTNKIVIGQIDSIYSNILDESRKIWIHIPESAKDNSSYKIKYPVLYLLDGPEHFYSVTGIIKQLSTTNGNTVVPEMIIVAIPNTDRSRDLTPTHVDFDFFSGDSIQYSSGGGNKFLDFMEDELIPHIEKTYPASSYRTFVGHSFGGLSVINALVNRQHLFNNYVAIDPSLWWDGQSFLKDANSILSANKFHGKALYVGVANTMDEGMTIKEVRNDTLNKYSSHIRSILKFVNSIDTQNDNGLLFEWKYYNDDDHSSVPLITEYDAFRFLFPWYKFKQGNNWYSLNTQETINLINSHYTNISEKFGYKVIPPERVINLIVNDFMYSKMPKKAYALLNLNIKNYPKSTSAFESLGDYYLSQSDTLNAIKEFKNGLKIGECKTLKEKLKKLENAEANKNQ